MIVAARARAALTTFPGFAGWLRVLVELAWLAPTLALLGWFGGLVTPGPVDLASLGRIALIALIVPAFAEEVIFRGAMLSAPSEKPSGVRCVLSILAFVAWHPLQVLWFGDAWAATVLNPWFLIAVAALGIAATRVYLATASLWPCVLMHWIVVVAWKTLGGASPWS